MEHLMKITIIEVATPSNFLARETLGEFMNSETRAYLELSEEINKYYNDTVGLPLHHPNDNEISIAKISKDRRWHRVRILAQMQTLHGPQVRCFLLDQGRTEMVPIQCFRKLLPKFLKVPFQVKQYALYGLKPLTMTINTTDDLHITKRPSKRWDESASKFFKSLVRESSEARAEIKYIDRKGRIFVQLYLKRASELLHLNEEFCRLKYAIHRDPTDLSVSEFESDASEGPSFVKQRTMEEYMRSKKEKSLVQEFKQTSEKSDFSLSDSELENKLSMLSSQLSKNPVLKSYYPDSDGALFKKLNALPKKHFVSGVVSEDNFSVCKQVPLKSEQQDSSSCFSSGDDTVRHSSVLTVKNVTGSWSHKATRTEDDESLLSTKLRSVPLGRASKLLRIIDDSAAGGQMVGLCHRMAVDGFPNHKHPDSSLRENISQKRYSGSGSEDQNLAPLQLLNSMSPSSNATQPLLLDVASPNAVHAPEKAMTASEAAEAHNESVSVSSSLSSCILHHERNLSRTEQIRKILQSRSCRVATFSNSDKCPVSKKTSDCNSLASSMSLPPSSPQKVEQEVVKSSLALKTRKAKEKLIRRFLGDRILDQLGRKEYTSPEQKLPSSGFLISDSVLIQGVQSPKPYYNANDLVLQDPLPQVMETLELKKPTVIQSYAWPAILRGRNMVGISPPKTGKTYSYLIPILSNLCQQSMYSSIPPGNSPLALILVASWKRAQMIYNRSKEFMQGKQVTVQVIYGSGAEENQIVPLINGCTLLVATLPCLKRMLTNETLQLNRICHLVIHDADIVLRDFVEEVKEIMGKYQKIIKNRKSDSSRQQLVIMSSQWTPDIKSLAKHGMEEPLIIITSMFEAAVYGNVKQVCLMSKFTQRSSTLSNLLNNVVKSGGKIIIFTSEIEEIDHLKLLLDNQCLSVLVATHNMNMSERQYVHLEWNSTLDTDSHRILLCTDKCLADLKITDATCVVNYDLPDSKTKLGNRFACMSDYFAHFDASNMESSTTQPITYSIITEQCGQQLHTMQMLLQRTGSTVPPEMKALSAGIQAVKEEDLNTELCYYMKAFGRCRNKATCPFRHLISAEADFSGVGSHQIKMPSKGEVKVRVSCPITASNFYVCLLEHRDSDKTTTFPSVYSQLTLTLATHFSRPSNRITAKVCVGSLCALEHENAFWRVKVQELKINKQGSIFQAKVWFVDNGQKHTVAAFRLFDLPEDIMAVPFQAVEVFLCRIKPKDKDTEWTTTANMFIENLIKYRVFYGRIVLRLGNTLWLDPMVERQFLKGIKVMVNSPNIRQLIVKENLALDNPQHLEWLYGACKDKIPLPYYDQGKPISDDGWDKDLETEILPETVDYHYIYVSAVEFPDLFYVQRHDTYINLEEMMESINIKIQDDAIATEETRLKEPDPGQLCLCQFSGDSRWYRGRIVTVDEEEEVADVYYIDYGNRENISLFEIHDIPEEFTALPAQAIECKLPHLKPVTGDSWSNESTDIFLNLTFTADDEKKILVAKVVNKEQSEYSGSFKYCLQLYDTSTNFDIDLEQELVWWKCARPQSTHLQDLFMKNFSSRKIYSHMAYKIKDLCSMLYWESEQSKQQNYAEEIQQIVSACMSIPNEILKSNGLESILTLLSYTADIRVFTILAETLQQAACNERLCNELLSNNIIHKIGWMAEIIKDPKIMERLLSFATDLCETKNSVSTAIADSNYILLDVVCDVLRGCSQTQVKRIGCYLLIVLCYKENSCYERLCRSKMCGVLMNLIQESNDHNLREAVLSLLSAVATTDRGQHEIKREKLLKSLTKHFEYLRCQQCLLYCARIFKSLADRKRKNKTLLLEQGLVLILSRLIEEVVTDQTAMDLCQDLLTGLAVRVPQSSVISLETRILSGQLSNNVNFVCPVDSFLPYVYWCQNTFRVLLSVKVQEATGDPVKIEESAIHFRACVKGVSYAFSYELYGKIVLKKSVTGVKHREVLISLCKVEKGKWPRLLKEKQKPTNLFVDFERFVDSSSDTEFFEDDNNSPFTLRVKRRGLHSCQRNTALDGRMDSLSETESSKSDSSSSSSKLGHYNLEEDYDRFNIFNVKNL